MKPPTHPAMFTNEQEALCLVSQQAPTPKDRRTDHQTAENNGQPRMFHGQLTDLCMNSVDGE